MVNWLNQGLQAHVSVKQTQYTAKLATTPVLLK